MLFGQNPFYQTLSIMKAIPSSHITRNTFASGLLVLVTLIYEKGPVQERVLYFLKLDKFGNPQWEKTIPPVGAEFIKIVDMLERADGSVLLSGYPLAY